MLCIKREEGYNNREGDERTNPNLEIPLHPKQLKKKMETCHRKRAEWSWGRKKAQYLTLK